MTMTIYYVATLARYSLVEADNEAQARERGHAALQQQQDHVQIRTIRHATSDEIRLTSWHQDLVASEACS